MERNSGSTQEARHLEGRYANYFEVGYNAFEFLLDFGQYYLEKGETSLHTRIITTPSYARALLKTLIESIEKYEKSFGPIQEG